MNTNKQLINLAGILIIVVLLVAGVALVALPMFTQSQTIDGQTRSVAQTNMVYEQQIAQLAAAEARIGEIDGELDELRREITLSPQLDDLHLLIASAAESVDVHVSSVEVSNPDGWSARGRGTPEEAPAVEAPTSEPAPDADAAAAAGTEPAPTDAEGEEAPAVSAEEIAGPQRQVLATIVIDVGTGFAEGPVQTEEASGENSDAADAEADGAEGDGGTVLLADDVLEELAAKGVEFVDALRKGPRLVTPIDLKYEDGELTVTVLTYYRTPDL